MTLRSQDGEPTGRARLTRAAFAALLLGGVGLGRRFGLGSMLAWSPAKQASHDVSFANWIRYTELREEIRDWSGPGPGAIPWRIESGWMQPIGTLLYQQVPQALTGVLSLRFSLADDGVARILLGVDRRAANLHMLEVVSSNAWLTLRAFRLASGARTPIAGDLRMERLNRSLHDLRVQFNGQAIHATLNNHPAQWSNLHLRPGRVGLAGSPDDRFRVYQARLSLDA
ncbi:MAG: hypothetical protein R2762_20890 [Bryobacteraceae bacterium]